VACSECGGKDIIETNSEMVCQHCGLVLGEIFQKSTFLIKKSQTTKGGLQHRQSVAMGDRQDFTGGLGTFIDYEKSKYLRDKYGKILPPSEQRKFRRLKKNYSQFLRIKDHETEYRIFNILNNISTQLNLNRSIKINAGYYFKKIIKNEEKITNNITLIAFCIFYAIRKESHNAPINIFELCKAFTIRGHRVSPKLIMRDGMLYRKYIDKNTEHHKSEDYIVRLLNEIINHELLEVRLKEKQFPLSKEEYLNELTIICRKILSSLSPWKRGGRNPFIMAGTVIYLADKILAKKLYSKAVLTQVLISKATKIPEYSIRDHYVNLLKPIFINEI